MTSSDSNIVLMIGSSHVGKTFITNGYIIIEVIRFCDNNSSQKSNYENLISHNLSLNTKYYTCNLDILEVPTSLIKDKKSLKNYSEKSQALIFIFDATSEDSFNEIEKWTSFSKNCSPDLLFCIANNFDNFDNPLIQKAEKWANENLFEFICVTTNTEKKIEQKDVPLAELVDTPIYDINRLVEAFKNNLWKNVQLKNKPLKIDQTNVEKEEDNEILEDNNSLEEIISRVKIVREQANSLPDQARRKLAADTAMEIAKMLEMFEEEE